MTPKWHWLQDQRYTLYVQLVSSGQPFSSYSHFDTVAAYYPQMTLATIRLKVIHICVTNFPEFQILLRFALRPTAYELSATSALNDPRVA